MCLCFCSSLPRQIAFSCWNYFWSWLPNQSHLFLIYFYFQNLQRQQAWIQASCWLIFLQRSQFLVRRLLRYFCSWCAFASSLDFYFCRLIKLAQYCSKLFFSRLILSSSLFFYWTSTFSYLLFMSYAKLPFSLPIYAFILFILSSISLLIFYQADLYFCYEVVLIYFICYYEIFLYFYSYSKSFRSFIQAKFSFIFFNFAQQLSFNCFISSMLELYESLFRIINSSISARIFFSYYLIRVSQSSLKDFIQFQNCFSFYEYFSLFFLSNSTRSCSFSYEVYSNALLWESVRSFSSFCLYYSLNYYSFLFCYYSAFFLSSLADLIIARSLGYVSFMAFYFSCWIFACSYLAFFYLSIEIQAYLRDFISLQQFY